MSNQLEYAALETRELRARFAVRALGWSWWRHKERGLAGLYPPEESGRIRWNFDVDWHNELPGEEWPPDRFDDDGVMHLYGPDWHSIPPLFERDHHPHPGAWYNVGRVLEAMREQPGRPDVFLDSEAQEGWGCEIVLGTDTRKPESFESVRACDPDPERAALIAALRALDAEAAQAVQSESEAHDAE